MRDGDAIAVSKDTGQGQSAPQHGNTFDLGGKDKDKARVVCGKQRTRVLRGCTGLLPIFVTGEV